MVVCTNNVSGCCCSVVVHCKKELAVFPSPAGMSLIKLFLDGNNLVFSRPERVWSVTSRLGTGKWLTLFYSVTSMQTVHCIHVHFVLGAGCRVDSSGTLYWFYAVPVPRTDSKKFRRPSISCTSAPCTAVHCSGTV
jgi:hypothetical protein